MRWEELPMASRARLMAAAVRNGYTDIRSIKEAYANYQDLKLTTGNRYDEGGEFEVVNLLDNVPVEYDTEDTGYTPWFIQNTEHAPDNPMTNQQYYSLMEKVATENNPIWNTYRKEEGLPELTVDEEYTRILNDNSYDYRGYYNDPAVRNSNDNANTHWPDEYKTAYHPTFSTYSLYSGMVDPNYNPTGKNGGLWFGDNYVNYNKNADGGNLFGKGSQMNQAKQQSVGGLRGFFNLLDKYKIPYITTSEFRPGAVTKSGNASRHSRKDKWGYSMAVDAVPKNGNFENFMQTIYSYPEIVDYMRTHKIGALEEFTPEVKRKTGARGKNGGNHVHFSSGDGADNGESWAIQMRDNRLKHLNLDTYHPMQDVTWADVQARKQLFELTPEEETLLNTSALGTYNPEYVDRNDPNYRSALADAVALDESLDESLDTPANNWAKWNAFLSMQSDQSDPISQMATLASLNSNTTAQQKEAANWLFNMTGDGGQLYHGINFAAYGGNLFRGGGKKNNTISVGGVKAGSKANTEQCAKYSNTYLRENGYIANGNAWNQGGGSVVFSGYDGLERPAAFDKKTVEAYNSAASDNVWNNFDSNTLDKDSVYTVNMYYKGSPYLEEAFKNGTKGRTGTHTGYLKYENGDWYVVHNIHGKVHVDRFKNIQGGNKKYGVTGIYAPRTNNIFNRAITKLGFGYGGNLFYKGGLEDQFANTYLGIGLFPDYDSDFIATNNLQYLPYSQLNMMGHDPENIRIGNQGNQTMRVYDDKDATYLADANGNLVTSPLLRQMTLDYVKEHYGPMLLKAFLSNPDKYWDEYNRYRNSAITFDENGNPVSSGLPPIEKPIEPVAPEFWLLSAGASKAPSALNSVVSPLFNMAAVDNVIDDVTPYSSFGNLMSENVGGPELAWNLIHPAIAKDLWNLSKTAGKYIYNKVTKPNLTLTSDGSNVTYEMGANIDSPYRLESDHAATDLYKKMLQKEYYDFLRTGKMPETEYTLIDKDIVNSGYEETGLGEDVVNKLIHDTLGRRKIAHKSLSDSDRAYYEMNELDHDMQNIENAAERLKNIRVGTYDADVFNRAGIDKDIQGVHFSEFGEDPSSIIIKLGEKDIPAIKRHEGEHEIDEIIELTPEQKKKLKNAYDQDFVGLPDRVPEDDALFGLENMEAERTTTNGDARDIVLKHHAGTTDIYLQNKIIDKTSDEKIFEAVEKANGYGRRYITWLREHNKLTPKKALEFREAMKIAGITGIVAGTIYPTSL